MNVADQGLEFSQAIWFMLKRNAVKCHVVLICRLLMLRELNVEGFNEAQIH